MNKFFKNKKVLVLLAVIIAVIASAYIYEAVRPKHNEFVKAPSMKYARAGHTATLLKDGTVLITGGYNDKFSALLSAEIYYPDKNKFVEISSMNVARTGHTATLLQDGRVFIAGDSSAEIYDPKTKRFSIIEGMKYSHDKASLLNDGRVLLTGGGSNSLWAELFDSKTNKFNLIDIHTTSFNQQLVTLKDGNVLATNGGGSDSVNSELFDAKQNKFILIDKMHYKHVEGTATLLDDGNVLIAGGEDFNPSKLAEIYDYKTRKFYTISPMNEGRQNHTAILLNNGNVLIAGGLNHLGIGHKILSTVEVYTPKAKIFTLLENKMNDSRTEHTATLLNDGRVLITGGENISNLLQVTKVLSSSEIYNP